MHAPKCVQQDANKLGLSRQTNVLHKSKFQVLHACQQETHFAITKRIQYSRVSGSVADPDWDWPDPNPIQKIL